jgi:hypothetical protein
VLISATINEKTKYPALRSGLHAKELKWVEMGEEALPILGRFQQGEYVRKSSF